MSGAQVGSSYISATSPRHLDDTVSSSISIDAENNTAVRNLLLDFKPCHPSFVDSSVVESNTQCIAIRMMTNRDNTGVELILASYLLHALIVLLVFSKRPGMVIQAMKSPTLLFSLSCGEFFRPKFSF